MDITLMDLLNILRIKDYIVVYDRHMEKIADMVTVSSFIEKQYLGYGTYLVDFIHADFMLRGLFVGNAQKFITIHLK